MPENPQPTRTILFYGTSGTGKSTIGHALAERLSRCAFIEIDVLRYMIAGGLVAHSAGISPDTDPEEYERQCWLGVHNALRLAEGFAEAGFSSVIEGLEDECHPGTGWIEETFGDNTLYTVALICDEATLTDRWQARGWGSTVSEWASTAQQWYRDNRTLFDQVIDTSNGTVDEYVNLLYQDIF